MSQNSNITSTQSFRQAINILLSKPHVINKRLWGCKIWKKLACKPLKSLDWDLNIICPNRLCYTISNENIEEYTQELLQEIGLESFISDENIIPVEVVITELFPKSFSESKVFQLVIITNNNNSSVSFYDISLKKSNQILIPDFPYTLQLVDNDVIVKADCDGSSPSYLWLKKTLLSQIVKWMNETSRSSYSHNICKESLILVPHQKYYLKYNQLKLKYGKEMVKIWPECTDPSKFVYEDVAIATYLLLLWEDEERKLTKKHTFVDLGCGNGLLVYILTKEGFSGVGIDVRKRNIWDMYCRDVKLEEKTIVPSDSCLFPNTDWIIGNHSDELTPWIPVIAAKSSYECNFFLLPCCAYNFDGTKYQRKDSSKSQYIDYLEYIKELSIESGFNVDIDRLKIPSTKRICLVSKGRTYTKDKYEKYCNKIEDIIERDSSTSSNDKSPAWVKDFKPREAVERVRNCTQIDKNVISSIVKNIADYLLDGSSGHVWFTGKTVELSELIQIIPKAQLKLLKSECGGIQTLLKNNRNIFKVQSGRVQLRYPKTVDEVNKNKEGNLRIRQKPCWFYNNHPQGCPLLDSNCSFLHIKC